MADWLPNNHSAILIDDFPSPRDLAEFIKTLDQDDVEYSRYLEYKTPSEITNLRLLEGLESREWGVNDMSKPNYLNGFECFVCDRENERPGCSESTQEEPTTKPAASTKDGQQLTHGLPTAQSWIWACGEY